MIYYFSATGNSKALAMSLADRLQCNVKNITDALDNNELTYRLLKNEALGFVFPVYGWSIPNIVKKFIHNLKVEDYTNQYVFFAVTCGDDIGVTDLHVRKTLQEIGLRLNAGFSVLMPDCYVNLPGFDVDKDDERKEKLGRFSGRVNEICDAIENLREVMDIKRGALPYTKTYVLGGLFRQFLVTDKPFKVTDECIHCGACEKVCPTHNITILDNGTPSWQGHCTGCLACYHNCPVRAIRFGKHTEKKGQYLLRRYKNEIR